MSDKQKALEVALLQIEKQFGKGSIMKMGEAATKMNIEVIPTGALSLDLALGVGGIPGEELLRFMDRNLREKLPWPCILRLKRQKLGGIAAFIDAEHALDPLYAKKLGVDIDNLLISQPDTGEQALEIVKLW